MRRGASDRNGRRGLPAPFRIGLGAVVTAVSLFGCSFLLNWNDYTGGTSAADGQVEASDDLGGQGSAAGGEGGADAVPDVVRGSMRCVPEPPQGWSGPMAIYLGPPQTPMPVCEPNYPTLTIDGYEGLNAPPANCSACVCSPPQGASCSPPNLTTYSDFACQAACGHSLPLTVSGCATPSCTFGSFTVSAPTIDDGGVCTQSGGTATMDPPTWSHVARVCSVGTEPANSRSCRTDEVLLPLPATPFEPRLCILSSGQVSCPGGPYSQALTVYSQDMFTDTRGCSDCTCDPPTGGSCAFPSPPQAGYAYNDPKCMGTPFNVPLVFPFTPPTSCRVFTTGTQSPLYFRVIFDAGLEPGSCAHDGGNPTGMVTPMGSPSTLCCTF